MASSLELDANPYEALGLGAGSAELTMQEIKKAYRKKALELHPDKRQASQREAAERDFNALQKAYDLLCDEAARAAWDGLAAARSARRARDAGQDERRKKMREDLEARERDFASRSNDEEVARARLRNEIARLRKAAAERAARGGPPRSPFEDEPDGGAGGAGGAAPAAAPAAAAAHAGASAAAAAQLRRSLKLVWDRRDGEYTAARLREIFSEFGAVEDVVLRDGKKARGGALVVMATPAAARVAAASPCGDMSHPLLVVLAGRSDAADDDAAAAAAAAAADAAHHPHAAPAPAAPAGAYGAAPRAAAAPSGSPLFASFGGGASSSGAPAFASFPSFAAGGAPGAGGAGAGAGAVGRDYENVTLHRMRAAAERARAVAAAAAAAAAEEEEEDA